MKKVKGNELVAVLTAVLGFSVVCSSSATEVKLFVDAAPNVYGSSEYPNWKANTYAAIYNGTFQNMANGVNPANVGTTDFEIQDEVVYSFGDLGRRLTWIYYIPGVTISDLQARTGNDRLQFSLWNQWGNKPEYDFYYDCYGKTWLEPSDWNNSNKIMNYEVNGQVVGVIGTAGMAWWGAYGYTSPSQEAYEALASDLCKWGSVDEKWIFKVKLDGNEYNITSVREGVPDVVSTLPLLGIVTGALIAARKRVA
ncbi:MAG: hypothetical protein GX456_08095 [Verrucomicrobia bacterium]|nr:hypothetical protein [Verrucomicrobiota bacterium]